MYLVFDGEFGGFGLDKSLLTMYFGYFDMDFTLRDELYLKLIPDDGVYRVDYKALEINKIDLVELGREAITYKEGGTKLYKFLNECFKDNTDKLLPVGQSLSGDIDQITDKLVSNGTWNNFVSRRTLDTATIAQFLRVKGVLPYDMSISLESLMEYFDIKIEGNAHEAKYDALGTIKVFEYLMGL